MRVVIDTNVLISAIFWTGRPKQLLNSVRRGDIMFLTSPALLDDLRAILTRPDKSFRLAVGDVDRVVTAMRHLAEMVQTYTHVVVCRDEADNRVLECAIDGQAKWIVTGDRGLLELPSFREIRIATVADFSRLTG